MLDRIRSLGTDVFEPTDAFLGCLERSSTRTAGLCMRPSIGPRFLVELLSEVFCSFGNTWYQSWRTSSDVRISPKGG
jgi:hypothetical protein